VSDPLASIHLRRTDENDADIDAAAEHLGRRVGIAGLLRHLNRRAVRRPVPGRLVEWGFTWDERDGSTAAWFPQGITTSADAGDRDDLGGRRLVVTSWYSKKGQGSRVTVVDLDSLEYRHVLLVVPERDRHGGVRFAPLPVHAGGLVWCGPYLHVAGTRRGLVSCLVDDLVRVDDAVLEAGTTFGCRYVLPVRFAYDAAAAEGVEQMRYSFLSLDRVSEPPQLLAGEYGRAEMTRRLVRYPLDPETYHLSTDEHGTSHPVWLDERGLGHMQGAAVVGDTYYVTCSRGQYRLGHLCVGRPGSFTRHPRALPVGPEDISYWPSEDVFWSLSEHPGKRFVFCVRRALVG
jgi:hypothetical protein